MGEKGREMKGDKGMMDGERTVEVRMDDFYCAVDTLLKISCEAQCGFAPA